MKLLPKPLLLIDSSKWKRNMTKVCEHCRMEVGSSEAKVGDLCFHSSCFVCEICKVGLLNQSFRMREVLADYHQ